MKHLLFFILVLFAGNLCAQKSGHIDYNAIVQAMPETTEAVASLKKVQTELSTKLQEMQKELDAKSQAPKPTNEALIKAQEDEISAIKARITSFQQSAQESLQKEQTKLFQPIMDKAKKALSEVAKSQGLTYVYEVGNLLYFSDASVDLTKPVKEKLGIKEEKEAKK